MSCKPTSAIVTSKAEAEKKGYTKNLEPKLAQKSVVIKLMPKCRKKNNDGLGCKKKRKRSYNGLTFDELSRQLVETATDNIKVYIELVELLNRVLTVPD